MRRRQQPCRVQRISRALGFFLGKIRTYHMRYIIWSICSYAFVHFSKITWPLKKEKSRHQKKKKQQQQHKQVACSTTRTGRCAHHTAHFVAAMIPAACIPAHVVAAMISAACIQQYFSALSVGCGLLTALWLARYM